MIVVKVRDRDIKAAPMGPVTTGSVGLPVSWHFSEEWDELAKTAVFRVGNDGPEITVAVLEDLCLVPDELLVQDNAGENLWIGVYGWQGEDDGEGNATIAMPTIWTYTRIQDGSQPSGIEPPEGTPGWSEQIQNATNEALRVAHGVAADAAAGEFDGISPEVTIADITHGHRVTITDREHPVEGQSFDVMDGASAYEQAAAGGYEGTEAEFNADLAGFSEKEQTATSAAEAAAQSAQSAADSESTAIAKAQEAADSAETALTRMNSANSSAQAAANSATSADNSASAADQSANDAESAKNAAVVSASTAADHAANAASSATAASGSATAAANSATAAGNAQAEAETAQEAAEDAQEAAEQAQSDAETAAQSVSQSAAQISQNASDINDLKSAVNDPVTGLNTKAPVIIDTASGAIASFDDGADGMPIKSLTVNIEPVQAGSGDPSPTNVRPISGWIGCNIVNTAKNYISYPVGVTVNRGVTYNVRSDGSIALSGTATGGTSVLKKNLTAAEISIVNAADTLYFGGGTADKNASETYGLVLASSTGTVLFNASNTVKEVRKKLTDITQAQIIVRNGVNVDGIILKPFLAVSDESKKYTLSFNDTIYGGALDVPNGVLTVDRANIASYSGETLPGKWISDRDVYAAGTIPTTGAQVVYELATPIEITLTPTQIDTLLGTNNIWADCGLLSAEYPADAKMHVEALESAIFPVETYASRAIALNSENHDIPQNRGILNAYKKAMQLKTIPWTALAPIPSTTSTTGINAGEHEGLIYSSVKEYDKFVGYNVSLRTFMTAAHNPYSLLYTEDTSLERAKSEYGIAYHGVNCGAYFGIVCNVLVGYALGWEIPWNIAEWDYLCDKHKLVKAEDQSAYGMRRGDIVWEPGHGNIIIDIVRDTDGNPVTIYWAESVSNFPKIQAYTASEVNNRLATKNGILYYDPDNYKNTVYSPSEFVAVGSGESVGQYAYNDDICTYAGDYACFNSSDDVWINYTAGAYTQLELYKGETLLSTINIDPTLHKIKLTTDGYGKYKARLKNGGSYSEYTYFEIVDTRVSASYNNGILTVDFSSANGRPEYAQLTYRNGKSRGIIELTEIEISRGQFTTNPIDVLNIQYPGEIFEQSVYIKVFFRGDYGVVPNAYLNTGIVS